MPQTQPISIQRVLIAADFDHLIVICPSAETAITADAKFTRVRVMSRRRPRQEAKSRSSDLGT